MEQKLQLDDLMWAYGKLRKARHGDALAIPATKLIYTVDHQTRTLVLQDPGQLTHAASDESHRHMKAVFSIMKYDLIP